MAFTQSSSTILRHSFRVGQRVALHPATDRWARGDRYGEVLRVGRKLISVKLDRSGQIAKMHPSNLLSDGE
jgi:hypothetical protein